MTDWTKGDDLFLQKLQSIWKQKVLLVNTQTNFFAHQQGSFKSDITSGSAAEAMFGNTISNNLFLSAITLNNFRRRGSQKNILAVPVIEPRVRQSCPYHFTTTTLPPPLYHHHFTTTTLPPPLYHHIDQARMMQLTWSKNWVDRKEACS